MLGERRKIFLGIFAKILIAFKITAEGACIREELVPVTMVPSFNWIAAPENIPECYFPRFFAFSVAMRAGSTTTRSIGETPTSSKIKLILFVVDFGARPAAYSE